MKYFVVSEEELERLIAGAMDATDLYYGTEGLIKAEAACRQRPVPEDVIRNGYIGVVKMCHELNMRNEKLLAENAQLRAALEDE